jgi:hypothetical protein
MKVAAIIAIHDAAANPGQSRLIVSLWVRCSWYTATRYEATHCETTHESEEG